MTSLITLPGSHLPFHFTLFFRPEALLRPLWTCHTGFFMLHHRRHSNGFLSEMQNTYFNKNLMIQFCHNPKSEKSHAFYSFLIFYFYFLFIANVNVAHGGFLFICKNKTSSVINDLYSYKV